MSKCCRLQSLMPDTSQPPLAASPLLWGEVQRVPPLKPLAAHCSAMPFRSCFADVESDVDSNANESPGPNTEQPQRPQPSPHQSEDGSMSKKKDKPFRNPLTRSKSIRRDSNSKQQRPTGLNPPSFDQAPNTAPLNADWSNSDMSFFKNKSNDKRGKSAERGVRQAESDENLAAAHAQQKEKKAFKSGSKNVLGKAKTGGGNFFTRLGKMGRSGSNSEKEVSDAEYQLKIINLPLVEQTRITRISKKIEHSKDKTEYWMPSLPWRCIEYVGIAGNQVQLADSV